MVFLNLLNKIFGPRKPVSRQEIDDYGTRAEDTSDFNDQTLKGWKTTSTSVSDRMSTADKKVKQFVNKRGNGGSSTKRIILSFILFILTMLVLIIFTYQGNTAIEKKSKITEEPKKENTRNEAIDFYSAISTEKQITSDELILSQQMRASEKQTTEVSKPKNSEIKVKKTTPPSEEEIQFPIQSSGKIPDSSKSDLAYKNAQEVYLSELKNVVYRAYRDRPIKVINSPDARISDNQSSKDAKQDLPSLQTTEISYIDYLTTSAELFRKGQYKTALKHYLTILDIYPDDVNANFYGGLCYFNLGQFDQSTKLLRKSYTLGYGNFRKEARWFSAKAYVEQGHEIRANYLLHDIIKEGGFYSESAKELLD